MKKYKNISTGLVFECASPVRGADIIEIDAEKPVKEKPVKAKKETKKNVRKKPVCESK